MILRSSSTPVVQTILSDSPTREFDSSIKSINRYPHTQNNHCTTRVSIAYSGNHLNPFSCNSSPAYISTGIFEFRSKTKNQRQKVFRRAQSDSNLEGLSTSSLDFEEFYSERGLDKSLHQQRISMLQTEPSFSIYNDRIEEEDKEDDLDRKKLVQGDGLERSVTIGDSIDSMASGEFSFGKRAMGLIKEDDNEEETVNEDIVDGLRDLAVEGGEPVTPPMFLATGLGIDGDGSGRLGVDSTAPYLDGDLEDYYRRIIKENPSNSLYLRNYAQLLQSKGDLSGAEEYYLRATLADPEDGEILVQYARLCWELHHDWDRAFNYFERAARAAPEDSHVLAAYASFLWELDEDEEGDHLMTEHNQIIEQKEDMISKNVDLEEEQRPVSPPLHLAMGLGVEVAGFGVGGAICHIDGKVPESDQSGNVEQYYESILKENPCNPLFLRNYARYLHESKGDLQGAEEYYSRAMLADPSDGEITSQYAQVVWERHHDRQRALPYFEQAVQVAPEDSNVLGAYAKFMWETEDNTEEEIAGNDQNQMPHVRAEVTTANS